MTGATQESNEAMPERVRSVLGPRYGVGRVERMLARLYERLGSRIVVVVAAGGLGVAFIDIQVTWLFISRFHRMSTAEFLKLDAVGNAACMTGAASAVALSWPETISPILGWSAEDRSAGTAARLWEVAVTSVRATTMRGCAINTALLAAVTAYGVADLGLGFWVFAPVMSVFVLAVGAAWVIIVAAGELVMRPMLVDIAAHLPTDFRPPTRGLRLQTKAVAPLLVVTFYTAMLVSALTVQTDGVSNDVLRGTLVLGGTFGCVCITGVIFLVIAGSVLDPLDQLTDATRRVRAGDLGTPVPVVTDDDLGDLAHSFNLMLDGLRERELLRARNEELLDELRAHADELRASRARIVAAADAERRGVERDLHDCAQQHLVLLGLKLSLARRELEPGSPTASTLVDLSADLERALRELRDLAHGIYPAVLANEGLPAALREVAGASPIPAKMACDGAGRYREEVEAAVYFCCLEALQNVVKHAGVDAQAAITIGEQRSVLRFEVCDSGCGFEVASAERSPGLQNMLDRIGALGGTLRIESTPGLGTTVTGTVPIG
ncbi:MAG: sensor histidine kinase [Solirubrobacteraceae bacterium]